MNTKQSVRNCSVVTDVFYLMLLLFLFNSNSAVFIRPCRKPVQTSGDHVSCICIYTKDSGLVLWHQFLCADGMKRSQHRNSGPWLQLSEELVVGTSIPKWASNRLKTVFGCFLLFQFCHHLWLRNYTRTDWPRATKPPNSAW